MLRCTLSALLIAAAGVSMVVPAQAGTCFKKTAVGNGISESVAKFEADTAILLFTDFSIYASYMAGNGTPGYTFGPRTYKCGSGLFGYECQATAKLCKL